MKSFGAEIGGETNELLSSKETDFKQALKKFSETNGSTVAQKEHWSNDAKNNEKGKPSGSLRKTEVENLL